MDIEVKELINKISNNVDGVKVILVKLFSEFYPKHVKIFIRYLHILEKYEFIGKRVWVMYTQLCKKYIQLLLNLIKKIENDGLNTIWYMDEKVIKISEFF